MKRFAIFTLTADGHQELYADTDLASEAESFEELGYLVLRSAELALTSTRSSGFKTAA